MFKESFYSGKKIKEWNTYINSFNMLMLFAFYENSINGYKDVINVYNTTKLPVKYVKLTKCFSYKGILSYLNGDYDASLSYFQSTVKDLQSLKLNKRYLLSTLILMARVYITKHDYANALKIADKCKRIIVKDGKMPDILSDIYDIYRVAYAGAGKKDKSKDYEIAYYKINDSLFNFNKFSIIQNIDNMYKIAAKDMLIKRQAYKHNLEINVIVMLLFFLSAVTTMTILLYKKMKNLHQANVFIYNKCNEILNAEKKEKEKSAEEAENDKYNTNPLSEEYKDELQKKIDFVLHNDENVFSQDFTIEKLAELVDADVRYVSQIVNVYYGKNFSAVIGDVRVHEACRRIADKENYGNYTLEAIACGVGFKTRQNFNVIFKKVTGISPSKYKEISQSKA